MFSAICRTTSFATLDDTIAFYFHLSNFSFNFVNLNLDILFSYFFFLNYLRAVNRDLFMLHALFVLDNKLILPSGHLYLTIVIF